MLKSRIVMITGASAGIGEACAHAFAREGARLILAARRRERLEGLAATLATAHGTETHLLELDVREREQVDAAVAGLPAAWAEIDVLVNNAGLSRGLDKVQEGKFLDWEEMIDTNVKGLLWVTRAVVPGMIERGRGHIINIGSTAGKEVYPRGNVYCASKHAVDALTKGLRIDLLPHGIKVTQIAPGLAETEFSLVRFHGDADKAKQVYQGLEPLHPEDIAELVHYAASLPAHVCINDLVVTCVAQANSYLVERT